MAETYYVKPDNSPVNDLTLNANDAMFIANGGTANGTIINSDGAATVNDGGSANNTTVNEGGTLHLIGGAATGISVASDGRLEVNKGATATGIEAEKGATLVFDVAASTHIAGTSDGAAFQIQNGIATGFALETGVLTVSSGGTALNATLNSAGFVTVYSGGKAINAVANASGEIKVFSGGTATEATVKTGGKLTVESSGFCDDATIEMGGNLYVVSSGGTAAGTYIGTMGNLTVSKGGTAYGTTVGAGGFLTVGTKGIAEGADVNGFLNVLDGGLASNVTVNDGAVVYVQSKGTGSDVYVDYGGILEVLSDGRLKGATVAQGGSATIHADVMASNVVIDGGKVTVMSDGWAYQSGVSSNTIVRNGGRLVVSGGGYVVGAAVSAGGHVTVESDATFSSATVVAADVTALDGAFVSRLNLEAGGILNVVSGGKAEHINVSAGGVLTGILREASELKFYGGTLDLNIAGVSPDSEALVDEISFLSIMPVAEDYLCTLTVSETQAEGAYKLIEGASGFDTSKAITVKDTSGTTLGTLTVNGGSTTIGGVNYTLAVTTEDVLTVTIAGGVDLTGDLNSDFELTAGMVGSSVNILEGGKLNVYKDALASQTAINAGGSMVVSQGGSASDTTVNNGGKLYVSQGGIASKTELNDGGKLFASGSVGGATVSSGGSMFVSSGATASDINVSAGGMLWIDDGVTATGIVAANGAKLYLNVAPDTYVKGTYAESAFEMKDATLSDFTVRKDGQVSVSSGGVTSNITTLDKGYLWIYNGGVAKDTVVAGELGLQGAGAVVSSVTFQAGGHLSIYKAGGKLTGKVTFETGAGVYYSDGASATLDFDLTQTTVGADALVNDLSPVLAAPFDYTLTVDGTEAAGDYKLAEGATGFDKTITVKDTLGTTLGTLTVAGGKTTIDGKDYTLTLNGTGSLGVTVAAGGATPDLTGDLATYYSLAAGKYASSVNILDGGILDVMNDGFASQTTVNSGGDLIVSAGGSADVVTVNFGGVLYVSNGATATQIKENGGYVNSEWSMTVTFLPNSFGGYSYNNADDWATIHSGTTGTNLTAENGGGILVSSGGIAHNITIGADGVLNLMEGGTAVNTTIAAGGSLGVDDGGKLTGKVTFETGAHVTVLDGAIVDFDLTQTTPGADALVNNLALVMAEKFSYTLTVDGTEADGTYKLAEGATGFDKTITVKDTLGTTLGTLTVAGGKTTIDGKDYTLTLTGTGSLGVTLGDGGGITPDITGDLNSDFELNAGMVGSSVNILEGGRLIVDGGGSADVVTVNSGGFLYVYNGGKATQIKENGGYVGENDGADVTFVSNSFGGYVYDSPDEWATIHSGTTGTDLTVGNDGVILVYSGGTAVDTTVAADGNLGVGDGGKLTGKVTIETGANVTVEDGAIVDFDLTKTTAGDPALVNDLSFFGTAAVNYTLTVDGTEADGDYKLAEGATGFDQTITVVDTLGTELGTLTVNGGSTTIGGVKYTLLLTGSNLSVTLGEAIPTDTTPPDKPIPEASSELPTNGYVTVTATFSDDSVLRECSKDGENWVEYQSSGLTFVENGKAYFRATDGAGNVSDIAVYEVTNIDKVAPTISYITPSTTAPAASVTITASFDDDVSLASTQYRIGVGAWQDYTTGVTVTENTTVYFKAVDAAGNESEVKEYEVTNIIITGDITGKEYVSSGGMASGATVKAGGSLNILSGGVARDTLINAGGKLTVVGGGKLTGSMTFEDTASVTVQQFGIVDFDISKLAPSNAALVNNLSVIQGKPTYTLTVGASQAEGTYTLAGGASSFSSSITVKDTLGTELDKFYSFNQSLIIGGMVYTLTLTDDVLAVTIAGAGGGVDLTGDLDTTSGLAAGMVGSSVNILDGGNLEVFEGGFTSQTTVNSGGDLAVSEGGVADVVTVNFGGDLYIRNGGVATLVKENGGYASVNDGATATFVPNSFGGYVYNNADDWCTIHSGTTGTDLTVGNDGKITVYDGGVASQTTVNSNGDLYVSAGGSADVVTVNFGGDLYVLNGGVATLVKENGGYVGVDDGATATFVSNSFGGYVYNNADDWCTIHDGTSGSNLTAANKGRIYVYSGGVASDTTVNDKGIVEGNSGGLIDGVVVNSGGSLLIYNGAKLTGQMTFVAGAEVIPFVGSILDFDLTQTAPDAAALVNDLSILMGTPGYTLTVDGTQASGTYNLAGNATGFNKIISVRNTSGVDYGYLTFGGTLSTSFADYTLNLTADNTLTVNVAAKGGSDTTPPTITITPSTTAPAKSVTLTAVFDDDVAVATKEYMIDSEGVWKSYTGPVTVTENVYVSFRATDTSENGTVQGYNVTNIDSSAPEKGLAEPLNDWLFNKKDKTDPVNTALTNSVGTKLAASADPIQIYFDSTPSGTLNNFVGMVPEEGGSVTLDELDYAKVVLDHGAELSFSIDYTDAAKFTVWQLVPDKKTAGAYSSAKSIQATTLKNKDATLITGSGTKPIRLEAGSYYLSMQSTNAKKGGQNEYNVTATGTFFDDGDNSDDWTNMKTVGYGPGAEIDDLGVITDETLYLISGEWVGFGDAVDYKKFTLTQAAELSFAFSKQGADTLKFTVCQLKSTEKKGVVTYSQGWNKAATVKGKDVVGNLNDLLLEAGEYYIKIENTNAKKSNGAGYAVMVSESDFYTDCDSHANDYDSKAKAVSAAVGGYTAKLAVGALQIDGTLVADAGLDIHHDGYTNFVGFGDASDIVKINAVAGDTLSLKVEATDAVSLTLYGLKNGKVTSIKSVKSKNGAATIDNFTFQEKNGAEFFVGVEATNAKKGEKAWYNVEVVSFSSAPAAALTMPEADALAMTDGPGFGQYDAAAPADVSAASALADLGGMASQQAFAALA